MPFLRSLNLLKNHDSVGSKRLLKPLKFVRLNPFLLKIQQARAFFFS